MLALLPSRLLEVKNRRNRIVCIMHLLKAAFMQWCPPNFPAAVHTTREMHHVVTESRREASVSPTTAVKRGAGADPLCQDDGEHGAGGGSLLLGEAPRLPPMSHEPCLGSSPAVSGPAHPWLSSSDYRHLSCNPLIASHFWCHDVVAMGRALCCLSSTPIAALSFTWRRVQCATPHKRDCMALLRNEQPGAP